MSHRPFIEISIPDPCHENWLQMQPDAQGRYCAHCQKSVIDFTGWSDTALFNFFDKNTEGVCGRFLASQVNRPIHIPYQPHSRLYRLVIAAGLVLLFTQPTAAQTQSRAPLTEQTIAGLHDSVSARNVSGVIRGSVADENKKPVMNAIVQVCEGNSIKETTVTDSYGNYVIANMDAGRYNVKVNCKNHRPTIVTGVIVSPNKYTIVNISAKTDITGSSEPLIIAYRIPLISLDVETRKITEAEIREMPSTITGSVGANQPYQRMQENPELKDPSKLNKPLWPDRLSK